MEVQGVCGRDIGVDRGVFQAVRRGNSRPAAAAAESPFCRAEQRTWALLYPLAADPALDGTFMILFSWSSEYSKVILGAL